MRAPVARYSIQPLWFIQMIGLNSAANLPNKNYLQSQVKALLTAPGLTPAGGSWVMKALHPSDIVEGTATIPDETAVPSAPISFVQTAIIAPPTEVGNGVWDCRIAFMHHPVMLAHVICSCVTTPSPNAPSAAGPVSTTTHVREFLLLNRQLLPGVGGDSYELERDAIDVVAASSDWYRGSYCGATATLTAPTMADQGTVTAVQMPISLVPINIWTGIGNDSAMSHAIITPDINRDSRFDFSALQGVQGAYTAAARDGVYMPLKLTSESYLWRSSDEVFTTISRDESVVTPACSFQHSPIDYHQGSFTPIQAYENTLSYTITDGKKDSRKEGTYSVATKSHEGADLPTYVWQSTAAHATMLPCSYNMGYMYFTGLSYQATVTLTVRSGFELQVPTDSPFLTMTRAPSVFDPVAIKLYHAIAQNMLNAYPAEYNQAGLLWEVISSIASTVLPALGGYAFDWLKEKVKNSKGIKQAAAETEPTVKVTTQKLNPQVVNRGTVSAPQLLARRKNLLLKKRK